VVERRRELSGNHVIEKDAARPFQGLHANEAVGVLMIRLRAGRGSVRELLAAVTACAPPANKAFVDWAGHRVRQ